jgi:hypothetical protein
MIAVKREHVLLAVVFVVVAALVLAVLLIVEGRGNGAAPVATGASPTPPGIPTHLPGAPTPFVVSSPGPLPSATHTPAPTPSGSGGYTLQPATEITADQPTAPFTPTVEPAATPEPPSLPPGVVLAYAGSASGQTPAVDLPEGMYRVFIRADSAFGALRAVVEDGVCSEHPLFADVSGPLAGSAVYRSTGCRVRFEMEDTSGGWEITVETAAQDAPLTLPLTTSGDGPAATGVIDLPVGEYLLVFTTDNPYSMVVAIVVEGLCLERPVFLLTGPGTFEAVYSSQGCRVIFEVGSVQSGWELSISPKE